MKRGGPGAVTQPPEQLRYARWLEWGTGIGLLLLAALFLPYSMGLFEPHVPHARLPEVWSLPVSQFLDATGWPAGWAWLAHAHRADIANLIAICLLAGISVPALLALLPLHWRKGDWLYALLGLAEVMVVLLAASGVLTGGH